METLLETPFFQSLYTSNNLSSLDTYYKDFALIVYELLDAKQIQLGKLLFILNYTCIELISLKEGETNKEFLRYEDKAISLLKKAAQIVILNRTHIEDENIRTKQSSREIKWTGKRIELVELIYAIDSKKCINNGMISIVELCESLASILGIEIKDCYSSYTDIKRRKNQSRTYFLDEMSRLLNDKMESEDV